MPEKAKINHPTPGQGRNRPRSTGKRNLFNRERFWQLMPNVSIVRDESEAEYVVLASESDRAWVFTHYYITVYDNKEIGVRNRQESRQSASEAACDSSMLKSSPLLFS